MDEQWRVLGVYPDPASAEAVAGLLRSESVVVRIKADEPVPGLMKGFSVMVHAAMFPRAQAICAQAQMSDEEWAQYLDAEGAADEPE